MHPALGVFLPSSLTYELTTPSSLLLQPYQSWGLQAPRPAGPCKKKKKRKPSPSLLERDQKDMGVLRQPGPAPHIGQNPSRVLQMPLKLISCHQFLPSAVHPALPVHRVVRIVLRASKTVLGSWCLQEGLQVSPHGPQGPSSISCFSVCSVSLSSCQPPPPHHHNPSE